MVWKEPGQFVSEPIFVPRNSHLGNAISTIDVEYGTIEPRDDSKKVSEDEGVVIFTLLSSALQKYVQV